MSELRDGLGFLCGLSGLVGGVLLGLWLGDVWNWDPYFLAFVLGSAGCYGSVWLFHLLIRK